MSIRSLAKEAFKALETRKRDNGDEFVSFKTGSPDWMKELARTAHDSMMPDDYRYGFIQEALEAISSYDDADDARDSLEADIYTNGLTGWLHSRNDRTSYVDQGISEFGKAETIDGDLSMGQLMEKWEVFGLVLNFLEEMARDEEETA